MLSACSAFGAEIAICGRRKGVCEAAAEEMTKADGGVVKAYAVDIRHAAAVDAMVDAVAPGEIPTEGMSKRLMPGGDSGLGTASVNPMGRVGPIEELQNLAAFLLSDGCEWLTGATTRCMATGRS